MPRCPDCGNEYTTAGGLTRHSGACPEARARREAAIAAAGAPQVSITQVNISVQITQQVIAAEIPVFNEFLSRLLITIAAQSEAWREGAEAARTKLREIRQMAALSEHPADRIIGQWLAANEIERDVAEGSDEDAVIQHTFDRINQIEDAAIAAIKAFMPEGEKARFDEIVKEAPGLLGV